MRRTLLASLFALGLAWTLPSPAFAQLREGLYEVEGQNPDGTEYQGMLQLQPGPGGAWLVAWRIGEQLIEGVAMIQGGQLIVGYGLGGAVGVASYEVRNDGKLQGQWTLGNGVGSETLTPR